MRAGFSRACAHRIVALRTSDPTKVVVRRIDYPDAYAGYCFVTDGMRTICDSLELQILAPLSDPDALALVTRTIEHMRAGHAVQDGTIVEGLCKHKLRFIVRSWQGAPVWRLVFPDPVRGLDPKTMRDPWRKQYE